jgi:hypothetical protein
MAILDPTEATSPVSPMGIGKSAASTPSRKTFGEVAADEKLGDVPMGVRDVLLQASKLAKEEFRPFDAEKEVFQLVRQLEAEEKWDVLESVKKTEAYMELIDEMQMVNEDLLVLLDDEGWTLQKEAHGVHVWTRPEPGTDAVTVRIAGVQEGPFPEFCAIGKEVPMYKDWMTGVKESKILDSYGEFEYVAHYAWKFPLFTAREFLLQEVTFINDDQAYCMNRRFPPQPREEFNFTIPDVKRHHIRCHIEKSVSISVPLGKGKNGKNHIFVIIVLNIDMKMPLPRRLTNMLSVKVGFDSFITSRHNLKKAQEKSNAWNKSVHDPVNAAYYGRLGDLVKARESRPISCFQEIIDTGWVKDPAERRKIFARSENVLVPLGG